jgi:hypothetical protein
VLLCGLYLLFFQNVDCKTDIFMVIYKIDISVNQCSMHNHGFRLLAFDWVSRNLDTVDLAYLDWSMVMLTSL